MEKSSQHNLDRNIIEWVINAVNTDADVESVQQLKGSTSSTLHQISLRLNQDIQYLVVRQFDNKEWLQEEPDLAHHEAESLRMAEKVSVQSPKIIAYEETGKHCGLPVILMTMLEGSVDLKPQSKSKWLNGLAESLVKVHALEVENFPWRYFTYHDIPSLVVPSWTSAQKSWERAIEIVKGTQPIYKECFIHRDYHPTNILWKDGSVSGIVDWVNACRGPAGIDVGHCRLNLAMLYDVGTADAFLATYEQFAGDAFTYAPYWDFLSLIDILFGPPTVYPGWEAFGVTGLTDKMMEDRLDIYVGSLLERL